MALTFECARCGDDVEVQHGDELPGLKVKVIRVERSCLACGQMHEGLDAPEVCDNEDCPHPERGYGPAERIVSESVEVAVCSGCQDGLDTEAELAAALAEA